MVAHSIRARIGLLLAAHAICVCSCRAGRGAAHAADAPAIALPAAKAAAPVDHPGLRNVVAYTPELLSGSVPEGAEGFRSIRAMGVTTVISVDGAAPDVAAARGAGLRYIHLPIGYNGMDRERTLQIAEAIAKADGPVYLHCHHGKHRSACAAGAAAVTLGLMTPKEATARMKVSGTAPSYKGLYKVVGASTPASKAELASAGDDFPEIWKTSGLVKTMVEIDEATEALKAIEKAGWKPPADHPDLVPAAEAGRLADLLRVLCDEPEVKAKPVGFCDGLLDSSAKVSALEEGLAAGGVAPEELSARFKAASQSCVSCHVKRRDQIAP